MQISPVSQGTAAYKAQALPAKSSPAPAKTDTVTISPEAKQMSQSFSILSDFMDGAGEDGVITVQEIRAFGEKYQEKAEQVLDETMKDLGIPSDKKVTIRTDSTGTVRVDGDLSMYQRRKLEQALNEHPDFQQYFTKASSSASMLAEIGNYLEFTEVYGKDMEAAVARYVVGGAPTEFKMEYLNGESEMKALASPLPFGPTA